MKDFPNEDKKRLTDISRECVKNIVSLIINAFFGYITTLGFDIEIDEYEYILKTIMCKMCKLEFVFYDSETKWFYTIVCDDIKLSKLTNNGVEYPTPLPFKLYEMDGEYKITFGKRIKIPRDTIKYLYEQQCEYSKTFDIIKSYKNIYFSEAYKDVSLDKYTAVGKTMRVMDLCNIINVFNTMEVVAPLLAYFKMAEPNRVYISDLECIFYDADNISAGLFIQNIMYFMSRILEYKMDSVNRLIFSKSFINFNLRKPNKRDIKLIKKIEEDKGIFIDIKHCHIKCLNKKAFIEFTFLSSMEYQNL